MLDNVSAHANLGRQADPNNHKFCHADFSILWNFKN